MTTHYGTGLARTLRMGPQNKMTCLWDPLCYVFCGRFVIILLHGCLRRGGWRKDVRHKRETEQTNLSHGNTLHLLYTVTRLKNIKVTFLSTSPIPHMLRALSHVLCMTSLFYIIHHFILYYNINLTLTILQIQVRMHGISHALTHTQTSHTYILKHTSKHKHICKLKHKEARTLSITHTHTYTYRHRQTCTHTPRHRHTYLHPAVHTDFMT